MAETHTIHVILRGRTGNNLFQYALGRVLAKRHGSQLLLDGSLFRAADWQAARCIGKLPIQARLVRRWSLPSRLVRKLTQKHPAELLAHTPLREPDQETGFDSAFLDAPADCVVSGFFQSPRYFACIEQELRRELDLSQLPWPAETLALVERIGRCESVAVHVRRTDYVGRAEFDLCTPAYYRSAMERLRAGLNSPRFFLFSDEPDWCRQTMAADDTEVVELPAARGNPLHDLYLMSRARHQIIANSSYSWWAAWLSKRDGQRVLAPDRWLGGAMPSPIGDKLCPGWECVPV